MQEAKEKLLRAMSHLVGLPYECIDQVLKQAPQVSTGMGTFTVGRARLACATAKRAPSAHELLVGGSSQAKQFALTTHACQTMQSIAVAVQMSEPLLLVGESGTGKTTIVQHVAEQVRHHLVVISVCGVCTSSVIRCNRARVNVTVLCRSGKIWW
jgi:midasin